MPSGLRVLARDIHQCVMVCCLNSDWMDNEHMFGVPGMWCLKVVSCHDPSHGGFYMAEGALYIRIGLPSRVVSGDCLVSL